MQMSYVQDSSPSIAMTMIPTGLSKRRHPRARAMVASLMALAMFSCGGEKKETNPPCEPADIEWNLQLVLQASPKMNLDSFGEPLDTFLKVYQLKNTDALLTIDFDEHWNAEDPKQIFGESLLAQEQMTLFRGKAETRRIERNPKATHLVVAASMRQPIGTTWFSTYKIPLQHGEQTCANAKKKLPDPCFYVVIGNGQVDGGVSPPATFDRRRLGDTKCAPIHRAVMGVGNKQKK